VFLPKRSNLTTMRPPDRANEVEDQTSLMAHLKGRALCINVIGYLGRPRSPWRVQQLGRRHSRMIQRCTVVQFQPVRSLAIPPAPGHTRVGGFAVRQIICRGSIFHFNRQTVVATALRCAEFTPLLIEIIARQKVAPAFEPQKVSGRGPPASECNAMDASGPSALACCACSQHQACGDYSLSNVV
jgi:hypothetical protein